MKRELTPEQRAAVDLRGRTVLVSAAAGAGKTSVLVERLMGYVTGREAPRHVDEFLLLTFTRAAAGEMRARIASRLRELLREDPSNAHLRAQLTRVYTAKIGTLDAFCHEILRENAALAGFPSGFRIGDETELTLLETRVLEDTLEALYETHAENPGAPFSLCAELYGDMRGDRTLSELILSAWRKMRARANAAEWAGRQLRAFATFDPSWPMIVLRQARETAAPHRARLAALTDRVGATSLAGCYGPALAGDLSRLDGLLDALTRSWDGAETLLRDYRFDRLGSSRGTEETVLADEVKDARKNLKAAVEKIQELVCGPLAAHREDTQAAAPILEGLFAGVAAFDQRLRAEKTHLKILDFTDIEHEALALLAPDGQPGPLAERYGGRFCEIMVDEYQDLSPVQDALVSALSRNGENVFYVGDVRQSIYRFQMAEPALFLSRYDAFPDYTQAPPDGPCKILLTKNFRSRPEILNAVNRLLSRVDCPEMGALRPENSLLAGKSHGDAPSPAVELLESARGDEESRVEAEAAAVARRLRVLLDGGEVRIEAGKNADGSSLLRPARPGDAVILMRSPNARLPYYRAALSAVGLDCAGPGGESYFDRPEISAMIALLKVIDNGRDDLALLSALRSPLVCCTPAELAELRLLSGGTLLDCVLASPSPKITAFAENLTRWRMLSRELSPFALAARILADTRLPGLYEGLARENLLELPEALRGYPGAGLRGLSEWLAGQSGHAPVSQAGDNAVRIMSIHKAKGLEFPIVVLADLDKRFNREDQNARLLIHPRAGLGPKRRDACSEYPTIAWKAVRAVMDSEMLSEELRLLYVGMTRSGQKLILSCGPADLPASERLSAGEMAAASSMAQWVLPLRDPDWPVVSPPVSGEEAAPLYEIPAEEVVTPPAPVFVYPHAEAVNAPSKLTATGLKGRFIDTEAGENAPPLSEAPPERRPLRRPRLDPDTPAALTAAERGSALHLFLQFADFARCADLSSAQDERDRLVEKGLLTVGQGRAIDLSAVTRFFETDLGKMMQTIPLHRECKFSLLVSAEDMPGLLLPPGERVLLQGVIDCWYEREDGLWLLDFKTDRLLPGQEEERARRYRSQLDAYAAALRLMTGREVTRRLLVFFATGNVIGVN